MAKANFTAVSRKTGKEYTVRTDGSWRKHPATAAQVRLISKLLHEREVPSDFRLPKKATKGGASDLIQRLDQYPDR